MGGRTLAVVGLLAERALLPPEWPVVVAGGDPGALAAGLAAAPADIDRVLSFGLAGGLDPALPAGALLVATRVRAATGAWAADPDWTAALARATGARRAILAGAGGPVATPAAKRALARATDAAAVDLESAGAAAFAARRGIPFAALRAVADTAEDALPRAALVGLRPDGRTAPLRVLRALLRRPGELPALLRTGRCARAALAALRGAAASIP